MHTRFISSRVKGRRGVALIITLAFVVLLTILIVAYFSRAVSERQVSSGSAAQTKVEIFAQGAADTVIGDLQQEILAGSVAVPPPPPAPSPQSGVIYKPTLPVTMIPCRVGAAATSNTNAINLIKQSLAVSGAALPFYAYPNNQIINGTTAYNTTNYPPPARASLLPSDTSVSLNGRSISIARWNAPLLLAVSSTTDYTPVAASGTAVNALTAPDWILVCRSGSNPVISSSNQALDGSLQWSATNNTTVVGRYAYNIYDEGGLLDANVAGYPVSSPPSPPVNTGTTQSPFSLYKPALAYADLTQVGLTPQQINAIVGWRNYASTQVKSGTFPNYTFPIGYGTNYYNYVVSNANGFLGASGTADLNNNGTPSTTSGQSDRAFSSRQQLIDFLLDDPPQNSSTNTLLTTVNALQYLTTFSRDLNQPSYLRLQSTNSTTKANPNFDYNPNVPHVLIGGVIPGTNSANPASQGGNTASGKDDVVNPSFLGVRVIKPFTRNDGSQAVVGEPLVKTRFALNRLAWITYEGPSATLPQTDANIKALIADGIPYSYLQQGTAPNIQKYFGLNWVQDPTDSNKEWQYSVHNGPSGSGATGPIMTTGSVAQMSTPRDPDFFELLKASINVGCLGKALIPYSGPTPGQFMASDNGSTVGNQAEQPYNYNYYLESDVDAQVLQIGANIIGQFQPANFPIRINFNDGSGQLWMGGFSNPVGHTFASVVNLPYLYELIAGNLNVDSPNPLPVNGLKTYGGSANSGSPGNAGYPVGSNTIISTGVGVCMQLPVIWNPTDPACLATTATNGTVGSITNGAFGATPVNIRVVADSCEPDQTGDYLKIEPASSGNGFWGFFGYGRSKGTTAGSGLGEYSCNALHTSPPTGDPNGGTSQSDSWYLDSSAVGSGQSIAHYLWTPPGVGNTGTISAIIQLQLTSGTTTWCPEPTLLYKSRPTGSGGTVSGLNFNDLNGNQYQVSVPANTLMQNDLATKGFFARSGYGLPYAYSNASNTIPQTNAPNMESGEPMEAGGPTPANGIYIGLEIGAFPYAWYCSGALNTFFPGQVEGESAMQSSGYVTRCVPTNQNNPPGNDTDGYMTYRMQYQDPSTLNWITYDMKYGKVSNDQIQNGLGSQLNTVQGTQSTLIAGFEGEGGQEGYWAGCTDPRTSRFGFFWSSTQYSSNLNSGQNASIDSAANTASPPPGPEMEVVGSGNPATWSNENKYCQGWIDPGDAVIYGMRPDPQAGFFFSAQAQDVDDGWPFLNPGNGGPGNPGLYGPQSVRGPNPPAADGHIFGWMAWVSSQNGVTTGTSQINGAYTGLAPGLLAQNNTDIPFEPVRFFGSETGGNSNSANISTPNYFADPDGIVRRAMGAFVPNGVGAASGTNSSPGLNTNSGAVIPSADTTVGLPTARVFKWIPNTGPGTSDQAINSLTPLTPPNSKLVLTSTNQAQSRPYFLHRPFHSVGELGYVFSDTPWRNLDFSTAESGFSPLLDVFCINDESNDSSGLVAGKVNLNTRQVPVLQAILNGAYMDPAQPALTLLASSTSVGITASLAGEVAQALVARTSDTTNILNGTGPLENVSDLVGKWVGNKPIVQLAGLSNSQGGVLAPAAGNGPGGFYDGKLSYAGFSGGVWNNAGGTASTKRGPIANCVENFSSANGATQKTPVTGTNTNGTPEDVYSAYADSNLFVNPTTRNGTLQTAGYIQRFREAPIRALSGAGQTRVWNLLIDVIAQTGRYPRSATSPSNFLVEGEQRYWVHVAIDRYTGQVLDKQVEVVKE